MHKAILEQLHILYSSLPESPVSVWGSVWVGWADNMASREAVKVYGCCAYGFGLSWALFTLCFLIINIIVFAEPQWIGDTLSSAGQSSLKNIKYQEHLSNVFCW